MRQSIVNTKEDLTRPLKLVSPAAAAEERRAPSFALVAGLNRMGTQLLSVALIAAFFAGAASLRAQPTIASIQGLFLDAQNNLQSAAVDFQTAVTGTGVQTATIADLNEAISNLTVIAQDMTNSSIQEALGKKYKTVEREVSNSIVVADKRLEKALLAVNSVAGLTETSYRPDNLVGPITYTQRKAVIVAFEGAANEILSGGLLLGKPLLWNKNPGTAGFYNPGAEAVFQIDSAGCDEAPVITVQNASPFSSPIDTSTVVYDTQTGVLKFKMGTDAGGGDVLVTACGQTESLEVYNYGKAPVAGVPLDFPQSLPVGRYLMTYSASGAANIPTTTLGVFPMTSLKAFYNNITKAFTAAINAVSEPGCTQSVEYSPYTDNSFTITYTVTCAANGQSAGETIIFTMTKE